MYLKLPAINDYEPVLRSLWWKMVCVYLWLYWVYENTKGIVASWCAHNFYKRFTDSESYITRLVVVSYVIIRALEGDPLLCWVQGNKEASWYGFLLIVLLSSQTSKHMIL